MTGFREWGSTGISDPDKRRHWWELIDLTKGLFPRTDKSDESKLQRTLSSDQIRDERREIEDELNEI